MIEVVVNDCCYQFEKKIFDKLQEEETFILSETGEWILNDFPGHVFRREVVISLMTGGI